MRLGRETFTKNQQGSVTKFKIYILNINFSETERDAHNTLEVKWCDETARRLNGLQRQKAEEQTEPWMWAKPWGKRLQWVSAHWALTYHLLNVYVTGAWLTCRLLLGYRPQTEKTQIYVKWSPRQANTLSNPSVITETDIKYGINPQCLRRWRFKFCRFIRTKGYSQCRSCSHFQY